MSLVEQAKTKGCIYEREGTKWVAVLRKRGRAIPIARFLADTQEEAARMWLEYAKGKK
jgi:hypothetical protein